MACTHIDHCPLFPYLNASLAGWRTVYCDSAAGWHDCARFRLSSEGRPVPLALLPNGKLPAALIPKGSAVESPGLLPSSMGESTCGPASAPVRLQAPPPPPMPLSPPPPVARPVARPVAQPVARAAARPAAQVNYFVPDRRHVGRLTRWTRLVRWLRAPA